MIKERRLSLGLSQKSLSKKVGICRNYLSKLENKKKHRNRASVITVKKLAYELQIDPHDLFDFFTS